jgi:hypothetical protein
MNQIIGTYFLLLLLITSCSHNRVSSQKDVIYPERLNPNDSIVVNYDSYGCFQHRSNVLVFKKDSVTIYDKINQWNQKYAKKKKVGTVKLNSFDQSRLKSLFHYYEGSLEGKCTTQEEVEIKYYIDKTLISSKKVVDGTCGINQANRLTSFFEFVERARKENGND